jgi:hypothetical protein
VLLGDFLLNIQASMIFFTCHLALVYKVKLLLRFFSYLPEECANYFVNFIGNTFWNEELSFGKKATLIEQL